MSPALVPRAFVVLLFGVEFDGYLSGRTVGRRRNVLFRGNGKNRGNDSPKRNPRSNWNISDSPSGVPLYGLGMVKEKIKKFVFSAILQGIAQVFSTRLVLYIVIL